MTKQTTQPSRNINLVARAPPAGRTGDRDDWTKFHVLMSCVPPLVHIFIFCKSLPLRRWNSYVAFHTPICLTCTTFVGDVLGTGFTGTILTYGLRPSRGHVPVVPLKCPSCPADILSNSGWPRFGYGSSGKGFSLYLSTVREKKKSAVPASVSENAHQLCARYDFPEICVNLRRLQVRMALPCNSSHVFPGTLPNHTDNQIPLCVFFVHRPFCLLPTKSLRSG